MKFLVICITAFATVCSTDNYRLDANNVVPLNYTVTIKPFLPPENCTFHGHVKIKIKTLTDFVKEIKLHSKELTFESVKIKKDNILSLRGLPIEHIIEDEEYDLVTIVLKDSLAKDTKYIIDITYKGLILDTTRGFYQTSYTNVNHESK